MATLVAPTDGDTPSAVSMRTASGPSGLGTTTQGWRPISVKIQPNELAANGATTSSTASLEYQPLPGTRPRRVSQSPTSARPTVSSPSPIISRNDQ